MCGIVGIWHFDVQAKASRPVVEQMCESISHRGPDDQGILVDGNMAMGMRRLSIIDLSTGRQPMYNEDGKIAVVFNGEIFNYPELRKELESAGHRFHSRSDTESLVHGYESWGRGLPGKLNGMFAFSVWDSTKRRLLIARDQIGVKPLYIYRDSKMFCWASEIKALLRVPGIEPEIDMEALRDFLAFGFVPAPRTMFKRITKLAPATLLEIEGTKVAEHEYWDVAFPEEHRSEAEWQEGLRELLDDAIERQLASDVPLGAFLSGGVDSSAIVSTMRRLGVGHIATYSIGFGGADAFHNELGKAGTIARQFETDHHEILVRPEVADLIYPLVWHLDEPMTDSSFIVTYLVSKLARETVTVILSGVGGDELFAGYRRYFSPAIRRYYERIPRSLHKNFIKPVLSRVPVDRGSRIKSLARYARGFVTTVDEPEADQYQRHVGVFTNDEIDDLLVGDARAHANGMPSHVAEFYRKAPSDVPLDRMFYADLKTTLVDSLLTFSDKMSMAASLEARVPLLDVRLVEFAARIPARLRLHGLFGLKHIFKRTLKDRLPDRVLYSKKQGFGTPISRWLRSDLRPMLNDLLSPARLKERGCFRPEVVWRLIEDHWAERADNSERIMALLTFEVWRQTFIDQKGRK